jgi:integrase
VRPFDLPQQPGTADQVNQPDMPRSATTSQISPPSGASTRRNFAFPRRVSSIPRCVTGGVSFGSAAAAVNAVFVTGHDTSKSRAALRVAALDLGVPPHIVRDIVDHSDIEVTMTIYAHAALDEKRKALRKLGDALG